MKNRTASKRSRLSFDAKKAKASIQPAAVNLAGAVGGGVVGAIAPPLASGIGGVLCLLTGAYTDQAWVTSAGAAMLVSTTAQAVNARQSPTGKFDFKTELHNGKERATTFLKALAGKFSFKKKTPGTDLAPPDELGELADPGFANMDDVDRAVFASGMDFANESAPFMLPQGNDTELFEPDVPDTVMNGFHDEMAYM